MINPLIARSFTLRATDENILAYECDRCDTVTFLNAEITSLNLDNFIVNHDRDCVPDGAQTKKPEPETETQQ